MCANAESLPDIHNPPARIGAHDLPRDGIMPGGCVRHVIRGKLTVVVITKDIVPIPPVRRVGGFLRDIACVQERLHSSQHPLRRLPRPVRSSCPLRCWPHILSVADFMARTLDSFFHITAFWDIPGLSIHEILNL
ncbi:MAG: hypothetical protein [Caudoviricetes sp.]|nr:MAG: hypothetical protein [Caudoviricetes sp.]